MPHGTVHCPGAGVVAALAPFHMMRIMVRTGHGLMAALLVAAFVGVISTGSGARAAEDDFFAGLAAYDAGNYGRARAIWHRLAEAGDANAQSALAGMYLTGAGAQRDFVLAAKWYRRAAEQGVAIAQLNLGDLYARGLGVTRNRARAWFWLSLAAEENSWAADRRAEVERKMTPGELATARDMLFEWRRRHPR